MISHEKKKKRKNMLELLGSYLNIADPARQTNFKALWRTFNYPKTIDDTLVNSLNTYSLATFQRKTKTNF